MSDNDRPAHSADAYDEQWLEPAPTPSAAPAVAAPPLAAGPIEREPKRRSASAGAFALVLAGAVGGAAVTHVVWRPNATAAMPLSSNVGQTAPGQSGQTQQQFPGQAPPGLNVPAFDGSTRSGSTSTAGGPSDAAAIAQHVDPGIVDINTTLGYSNGQAAGTGMVLTSSGEVLTNNHVIAGATSISVTDVGNGKTYPAKVVGYDKSHDVAVLQLVGASGLKTVSIASSAPQVGAGVVGVGNAGGRGGTPSYAAGVVTALGQTITASDSSDGSSEQLTGLIETNANIVAGDSGGPLVNDQGEVVGMDTAASAGYRFSRSADAYAIPIVDALAIARQIESNQASSTVHVGPTAMLGVGVSGQSGYGANGAPVASVLAGGPASRAGIVAGDTIVAADGRAVTSASDLSAVMLQERPGRVISIRYADANRAEHTVSVSLVAGPPQ